MNKKNVVYLLLIQAFAAPAANAHSLEMMSSSSFFSGLLHPIFGLDHLVILLAMGMIVGKFTSETTKGTLICAGLVGLMVVGLIGGAHLGAPEVVELIIAGSIFLAAFTLWQTSSFNTTAKVLFILSSTTLLAHGWAHGVEMGHASIVMFTTGMGVSSMVCTLIGFSVAQRISAPILATTVASSGALLTMIG